MTKHKTFFWCLLKIPTVLRIAGYQPQIVEEKQIIIMIIIIIIIIIMMMMMVMVMIILE